MISVDLLNGWGAAWWGFMARALVDASVLLALVLVVWIPLRRKMSAQLAHGLFCLVLLKSASIPRARRLAGKGKRDDADRDGLL